MNDIQDNKNEETKAQDNLMKEQSLHFNTLIQEIVNQRNAALDNNAKIIADFTVLKSKYEALAQSNQELTQKNIELIKENKIQKEKIDTLTEELEEPEQKPKKPKSA